MKYAGILIAIAFAACAFVGAGTMHTSVDSGKTIFLENKCTKCHSVESQGIERTGPPLAIGRLPPDLSGVGLKHTADWMQQWLLKRVDINGRKHLKNFGGSIEELQTVATWLATLRRMTR